MVLSIYKGLAGQGFPSSANESHIIFASFALGNNAPNSASAADDATCFSITYNACMGQFKAMGYLLTLVDPKKTCQQFCIFGVRNTKI